MWTSQRAGANSSQAFGREIFCKFFFCQIIIEKHFYRIIENHFYRIIEKHFYRIIENHFYRIIEKHFYRIIEKHFYRIIEIFCFSRLNWKA